ncbi:hypothetical protein ZWY2020_033535 [Hordeum vulgare]|nr:hypothetical protein ZWY2020_033535 [Hordeum vulgare]
MVAAVMLPELATQLVVPVAAAVGIAFAVLKWVLVSKVKVATSRVPREARPPPAAARTVPPSTSSRRRRASTTTTSSSSAPRSRPPSPKVG